MEIHEQRSGHKLPLDPLRELAGKLERDEEIDSHDTRAVRAAMNALIKVSHSFDRNYAADLVTVTRTNIELERIQREA